MLKYVGYDIVFREVPDEVTMAVNLSRCPNRCKGCHSPYLQLDEGEELTPPVVKAMLDPYAGQVTCLCLMGGDGDPEAVAGLLAYVKREYGGRIRTAWYSGRDNLPTDFRSEAFDYVKLGAYRAECGPLDKPTTNQRLYRINPDGSRSDLTPRFWRR